MESGLIELIGAFITGVVGPILYLIITNHQKKQLAKKKDTIKEVVLDSNLIQEEIEEIREEFKGCRVWITQFHTAGDKSSYVIPLFTLDEKFIGCLGCDYVKRKHRMTKNEWEHFQIKAGRIAGYLSNFLEI